MSIVKEIVELMDGQLRLRSKLGRDTTVTVLLPRMNAAADHKRGAGGSSDAGLMPTSRRSRQQRYKLGRFIGLSAATARFTVCNSWGGAVIA